MTSGRDPMDGAAGLAFVAPFVIVALLGCVWVGALVVRDLTMNPCWPTCEKSACRGGYYDRHCERTRE